MMKMVREIWENRKGQKSKRKGQSHESYSWIYGERYIIGNYGGELGGKTYGRRIKFGDSESG